MPDEPWDHGLIWQCRSCGAMWSSEAARDTCMRIDADDDRDACRR